MLELKLNVVSEIATLEIGVTPLPWGRGDESHWAILARLEHLRRDPWHHGPLPCCRDLPANFSADTTLRQSPPLLTAFRRSVIALVDGSVSGIGGSLALSADFLLDSLRTRLSPAGLPGSEQQLAHQLHLPRKLGLQRTRGPLNSGRALDVVRAMPLGLLSGLTTPKRSRARTDHLVRHLACGFGRTQATSPGAVGRRAGRPDRAAPPAAAP